MSGLPIDIVDTGAGSFTASPAAAPRSRVQTWWRSFEQYSRGLLFNPLAFARPVWRQAPSYPVPEDGNRGAIGTDIGNVGETFFR